LVVNGTLDLNGFSSEVGSLAGTGVLTNLATGAPAVLTAGANDADSFFSGLAEDGNSTLGLIKVENGTLTFTGTGILCAGVTSLFNTSSLGSTAVVTNAGGVLIFLVSSPDAAAARIAGAGHFDLGSKILTTGANGASTEVGRNDRGWGRNGWVAR
jgi:hypothetical protein